METVAQQVDRLVDLAVASGLDGVVASPLEAAGLRSRCGPSLRVVTPGIRPAGHASDDQTRTATAADAIDSGDSLADFAAARSASSWERSITGDSP